MIPIPRITRRDRDQLAELRARDSERTTQLADQQRWIEHQAETINHQATIIATLREERDEAHEYLAEVERERDNAIGERNQAIRELDHREQASEIVTRDHEHGQVTMYVSVLEQMQRARRALITAWWLEHRRAEKLAARYDEAREAALDADPATAKPDHRRSPLWEDAA